MHALWHASITVYYMYRTPLNVVYAGLQFLETRLQGLVDGDILDIIADIKLSCRDSINVLDDLLAYEKMDSELLQIEKSPLDIRSFVQESLRPFAVQAKLSNVTIRYHDSAPVRPITDKSQSLTAAPYVAADNHKIGQVLRNLIRYLLSCSPASMLTILLLFCL
jgi:signal transduction histidine kinase